MRGMRSTSVRSLEEILAVSKASEEFKDAVRDLAKGNGSPRIRASRGVPAIKILRLLQKLLESYPDETITEVEVDGRSGCSDFHGSAVIFPSGRRFRFWWDCYWKASQEGLSSWWGAPDQTRAARKFGYQCFRQFEEIVEA